MAVFGEEGDSYGNQKEQRGDGNTACQRHI